MSFGILPRTVRGLALFGLVSLSSANTVFAGVSFQTGNHQYHNVNFQSETHGYTVTGDVDGVPGATIDFTGGGVGPNYSPIVLHAQHGVAFVEAYDPNDHLYRLTLTADPGHVINAMDWKLDGAGRDDGTVTFAAYDASSALITVTSPTDTFALPHNGQAPFNFTTDNGTFVSRLVITSTIEMADIKQVSVDVRSVPEPGTLGIACVGLLGAAAIRRRRKA